MFKLRSALKYTPPDFHLFKERGFGFLWLAEGALQIAKGKFSNANRWFDLIDQGKWDSSSTIEPPKIFSMYEAWTEADDMLRRLRAMPEEERKKHLALDSKIDYARVVSEHTDLTGYIRAWERRHPDVVVQELNKQLQDNLDQWEKHLAWAEARPDLDRPYQDMDPNQEDYEDEDYMEGVSDFCWFRDMLQYAMLGIYNMKHESLDRLRGVKIVAYEKRLLELDKRFRRVMGNKRDLSEFWADRSFWWHHPPRKWRR